MLEAMAILALLAAVMSIVAAPFITFRRQSTGIGIEERVAELQAEKEEKISEIRDAELDFKAGKLTEENFNRLNRRLRAQALEAIKQIDKLKVVHRDSNG